MLLRYVNTTDLCLSCHAEAAGSVLGNDPLSPPPELGAGNFTFLYEDNLNDAPNGAIQPIPGHHAGHNVVSPAWGIPADPVNMMSPGGTFPADDLSCTSCHDPHGNANFRMLRGQGPVGTTGFSFIYDAPIADGVALDAGQETPIAHTAYQSGWSQWCANCHGYYHDESELGFEHPVEDDVESAEQRNYNLYAGPDGPTSGTYATAYVSEVPLEDTDRTTSSTEGATSQSRISCMTCHRAHATSAPASTRWDPNVRYLSMDGQVSGSYALPDPYGHPQQRALCIKCHYSDANHGFGSACMNCHREDD